MCHLKKTLQVYLVIISLLHSSFLEAAQNKEQQTVKKDSEINPKTLLSQASIKKTKFTNLNYPQRIANEITTQSRSLMA